MVAGAMELKRLRLARKPLFAVPNHMLGQFSTCLLYTSDAADERSSVDLGGRRIIKKKNMSSIRNCTSIQTYKKDKVSMYEELEK